MTDLYDIAVRKHKILQDHNRAAEVWGEAVKDPRVSAVLRSIYLDGMIGRRPKNQDLNTLVYAAQDAAEKIAQRDARGE